MNRDLTKGPVVKSMIMFVIPAIGVASGGLFPLDGFLPI